MAGAIWWVRRDQRLTDNQALTAALDAGKPVWPVFILDSRLLRSPYAGDKRLSFLFGSLASLDTDLRRRGSRLTVRAGHPTDELRKLLTETGAGRIVAEQDVSPFANRRDAHVGAQLPLELTDGLTQYPPGAITKHNGDPYVVYSPFRRRWQEQRSPSQSDLLAPPEKICTPAIESLPLPQPPTSLDPAFEPSETSALGKLQAFATGGHDAPIYRYHLHRDRPDLSGTSTLSPYLRFGLLSARQATVAAQDALRNAPDQDGAKGAQTWLSELIWREFYIHILHAFPQVRQGNFQSKYDRIEWRKDREEFRDWCAGRTGYPIVDAAMHQLLALGWMHNRCRMIVGSFLVKDLLLDWRWGERFFMQHLIDGDPAANNGGWQWVAGTGTDAAPYFRIFNPVSQSEKFDPEGVYIRRWLPALRNVPNKYIHAPWLMPAEVQNQIGCRIGHDYPKPIVDHRFARQRTLDAFGAAKEMQ